jgi:hypothetical protein
MLVPTNITRQKLHFPLLLLAAWTCFGLFFGTQNYIRDAYFGKGPSLPGYLTSWLLCGYSWGVLTVPVISFARRFSLKRLGWGQFFLVHTPVAAIFALLHLAIYVAIAGTLFGTRDRSFWEFYEFILVNEFQSSFLVYFVIVSAVTAFDRWVVAPEDVPGTPPELNGNGAGKLRRLPVKENGRIILVDIDNIDWVESYGNYVFLHTPQRRMIHRETMAAMERKLDPQAFVRIRRSAIVRVDQIDELRPGENGEYEVSLRCGRMLAATRRYRKNLENVIRA